MKVLVIDDEQAIAGLLKRRLDEAGHETFTAGSGEEGMRLAQSEAPDVVLSDLFLPDLHGTELIPKLLEMLPGVKIVMITGSGSIKTAVKAMKMGAQDYLEKPFEFEELLIMLEKIGVQQGTERELKELRQVLSREAIEELKIYAGRGMQKVYEELELVAGQDRVNVLILGETGAGKEHVARLLHRMSRRAAKPFVELNCAAIPENLVESELFGYEPGAFTDAKRQKKGIFESAQGGTVFLDEIGELSPAAQAKLLKVLEEKELRRLGGTERVILDVRVVAATNRDLEAESKAGRFRADLYYRLNIFPLQLPALRERRDDIPELARFFFSRACREFGKRLEPLDSSLLASLAQKDWPGNVRELRNAMESAVIRARGPRLESAAFTGGAHRVPDEVSMPALEHEGELRPLKQAVEEAALGVKKALIEKALKITGGNKLRASRMLQIDNKTMYNILKELGHSPEILADN